MKKEPKRSPGRPALDGAAGCTERVSAVITPAHRQMLDELIAGSGLSVWLRKVIETTYKKRTKK